MGKLWTSVKLPTIGFVGVGTGISTGTILAEFTARATGQKSWAACAVKGGVKFGVGLITLGISRKLGALRATSSFFCEMFTYGAWGSILLDIFLAAYPGGLPGLAEDWAVTTRTIAAGGKKVIRELNELERKEKALAPTQNEKGWF